MVTCAGGRSRSRRTAGLALVGLVSASALASSGCSAEGTGPDRPHRGATPTRAAAADACTVSPPRSRVLGLPVVDAETVRIAPEVIGERLTWQSGPRQVIAWVGVDAFDAFEDLDFVLVEAGGTHEPREWTTRVRPDLFVAEARTGHAPPCDLLYVSTEGLPGRAALRVVDGLQVALTPGEDVTPP